MNVNIKYVGFAFVFLAAVFYLTALNFNFNDDNAISSDKLKDNILNFEDTKKIYLQVVDTNEETTKTKVLTLSNSSFDIEKKNSYILYIFNYSTFRKFLDAALYIDNLNIDDLNCDYIVVNLSANKNKIICRKINNAENITNDTIIKENNDYYDIKLKLLERKSSNAYYDNYVIFEFKDDKIEKEYSFIDGWRRYSYYIIYAKNIIADNQHLKAKNYNSVMITQDQIKDLFDNLDNLTKEITFSKLYIDSVKYKQGYGEMYKADNITILDKNNLACYYDDANNYLAFYFDKINIKNVSAKIKEYDNIEFENIFSSLYYSFVVNTLKALSLIDADYYDNASAYFEDLNVFVNADKFDIFKYNVSFTADMSLTYTADKNYNVNDALVNCVYDKDLNKYRCLFINKNLVKN